MVSSAPSQMLNNNPRSVLRPEYLTHFQPLPSNSVSSRQQFNRRLNTNTAPVYTENLGPYRRNFRSVRDHPYRSTHFPSAFPDHGSERYSTELSSSRSTTSTVRLKFHTEHRVNSNMLSQRPIMLGSQSSLRTDSVRRSRLSNPGQAEQLRRSRETTTFAQIDSLLSSGAFKKVKDMYMRTRIGNNTANNSATRTTKKVNLSILHTVVRFRMRKYLRDIHNHIDHLLDTLLSRSVSNYHPGLRDNLASKLFGIHRLPCSPLCRFCQDLPVSVRSCNRSPIEFDYPEMLDEASFSESSVMDSCTRPSSASSDNYTAPMCSSSDVLDWSPRKCLTMEQSRHPPPTSIVEQGLRTPDHRTAVPDEILPHIDLPTDKSLISYHLSSEVTDGSVRSRARLDSLTLRIPDEFPCVDWSAADEINLGPCGDEPVDLHMLINDTTSDPLYIKPDETFFDCPFEALDVMHPLTNDKLPPVQSLCTL